MTNPVVSKKNRPYKCTLVSSGSGGRAAEGVKGSGGALLGSASATAGVMTRTVAERIERSTVAGTSPLGLLNLLLNLLLVLWLRRRRPKRIKIAKSSRSSIVITVTISRGGGGVRQAQKVQFLGDVSTLAPFHFMRLKSTKHKAQHSTAQYHKTIGIIKNKKIKIKMRARK